MPPVCREHDPASQLLRSQRTDRNLFQAAAGMNRRLRTCFIRYVSELRRHRDDKNCLRENGGYSAHIFLPVITALTDWSTGVVNYTPTTCCAHKISNFNHITIHHECTAELDMMLKIRRRKTKYHKMIRVWSAAVKKKKRKKKRKRKNPPHFTVMKSFCVLLITFKSSMFHMNSVLLI